MEIIFRYPADGFTGSGGKLSLSYQVKLIQNVWLPGTKELG
jgi:hypothetical protein